MYANILKRRRLYTGRSALIKIKSFGKHQERVLFVKNGNGPTSINDYMQTRLHYRATISLLRVPRRVIAKRHCATSAVFSFRLSDILNVNNSENSSGKYAQRVPAGRPWVLSNLAARNENGW